jgi:hypothetical protein
MLLTRGGREQTMLERPTSAQHVIREAARIARDLAETARLHKEPEEAARFEQIAAEAELRMKHPADLQVPVSLPR